MPLDPREDAYGSQSPTTNHVGAREDDAQDTAVEELQNLSTDPISIPRSIGSQSLVARNAHPDTHLCRRCQELDFESECISIEPNPYDGEPDLSFKIVKGTLSSDCILCKFLASIVPDPYNNFFIIEGRCDSVESLRVRRIPSLHSPGMEIYSFRVGSDGEVEKPWTLDLAKVDFDALRARFEHCKAKHTRSCRPKRVPVENLRVFNCATKKLENATVETKYAALSYVWGNPRTSDEYPQTIQDAFEVAQKLGLEYIWIDQLCIDQDGGSQKAQQIRQMHHIYNNAEITIAAAAGCDSAYGIPGVSGKARKEREEFKIGRLRFVEWYPDLHKLLGMTTWTKRGWTFQEELFSNRLLIFTDYEAILSCAAIAPGLGREHLDSNERDEDRETLLESDVAIHHGHTRNLQFPRDIEYMIEMYSARVLTYENDIINAFSGCLGMLEQAEPPTHHLWGSPIPLLPASGSSDGFQIGFQWEWNSEFRVLLQRRAGFPSWSWTGWIGPVSLDYAHHLEATPEERCTSDTSVALELETGERLAWADVEKCSFLKNEPELISRFILLRAWTVSITLELDEAEWPRLRAVMKTKDGGEARCDAVLFSVGSHPAKERFTALGKIESTGILMPHVTYLDGFSTYIMLVNKADESELDDSSVKDYYVRVGYAQLRYGWRGYPIRHGSGSTSEYPDRDLELLQRERKEIRLG